MQHFSCETIRNANEDDEVFLRKRLAVQKKTKKKKKKTLRLSNTSRDEEEDEDAEEETMFPFAVDNKQKSLFLGI